MDSTAALLLPGHPEDAARHRRRVHRPGNRQRLRGARQQGHGGRSTRQHPGDGRPRSRRPAGEASSAAEFEAIYTSTKVASLEAKKDGIARHARRQGRAGVDHVRPRAGVGRPPAELRQPRAGQGRREAGREGLHPGRSSSGGRTCRTSWRSATSPSEPRLAHKATAEARVAVDVLLGEPAEWEPAGDPGGDLHRPRDRLGGADAEGSRGAERAARGAEVPVGGQRPGREHRPHRGADEDARGSGEQARAGRRHRRAPARAR